MGAEPSTPLDVLFSAWRGGDRRAGDRLFAAITRRLRPLAERLGPGVAEDLIQDVLATFMTCASDFDVSGGEPRLLGWLRTTLRRRAWASSERNRWTEALEDTDDLVCDEDESEGERRVDARWHVHTLRDLTEDEAGVRWSTQVKTARLLDTIEGVVTGAVQSTGTLGGLRQRLGMNAQQMSTMVQRLRCLAAPSCPEPAVEPPVLGEAAPTAPAPAAEAPRPLKPMLPRLNVLDSRPRRQRRARRRMTRAGRAAWRRPLAILGGPGPPIRATSSLTSLNL